MVVRTEDLQVEEMPTVVSNDYNKSNTVIIEDVHIETKMEHEITELKLREKTPDTQYFHYCTTLEGMYIF
jgi:uncharacterized protein YbaP (TraB family)